MALGVFIFLGTLAGLVYPLIELLQDARVVLALALTFVLVLYTIRPFGEEDAHLLERQQNQQKKKE